MNKILAILAVLAILAIPVGAAAQGPEIILAQPPQPVAWQIEDGVRDLLSSNRPAETYVYAITYTAPYEDGWIASVVGLVDIAYPYTDWILEDGNAIWLGSVVIPATDPPYYFDPENVPLSSVGVKKVFAKYLSGDTEQTFVFYEVLSGSHFLMDGPSSMSVDCSGTHPTACHIYYEYTAGGGSYEPYILVKFTRSVSDESNIYWKVDEYHSTLENETFSEIWNEDNWADAEFHPNPTAGDMTHGEYVAGSFGTTEITIQTHATGYSGSGHVDLMLYLDDGPFPDPTATPTETATPTSTNTPTETSTPTITNTPTETATPTITATPSNTPTETLTPTITNTPENTLTPTVTPIPAVGGGGGANILLPFAPGNQMMYGLRGIHGSGDYGTSGMVAVDLVGGDTLGTNIAPPTVYASASGTISYICTDGTSVAVQVTNGTDTFIYAHLVDNANLTIGHAITKGNPFASIKYGSYTDECGWASQSANSYHLHWMFAPDSGFFQTEGYVLDTSTGVFTKGTETVNKLGYLTASGGSSVIIDNPDDPIDGPVLVIDPLNPANITLGGGHIWDNMIMGLFQGLGNFASTLPLESASVGGGDAPKPLTQGWVAAAKSLVTMAVRMTYLFFGGLALIGPFLFTTWLILTIEAVYFLFFLYRLIVKIIPLP
jgi:hypothetical protein